MIGIYGGTFDPVHYGHLRTALEVCECFSLDELRLIPCACPPHRDQPIATAGMRLEMLRRAITRQPEFVVDTRELDREGPSYMVDTLKSIRAEIGDTPLLLFIGADALKTLTQWFQWQRLFDYAHVIVMSRPGEKNKDWQENAFLKGCYINSKADLFVRMNGALFFQNVTPLGISATQIRQLVANNRTPRFLLPDSVIEFIRQNRLYLTDV